MDDPNQVDEPFDEELLQAQLDYDSSAAHEQFSDAVMQMEAAIGKDFAKTVRLLHDVLGSSNKPNETESTRARPHWELPQPFGRFKTIEKLGQGAFGAVWKAYDPILNRYVAIKALHPDLRQIPALHERFEQEAQAAARLNHPNIVRVFEVGSVESISYIVTEFVEGAPLQIFQSGNLAYPPRIAAKLIAQLADATHHSHQQGVLHRDIKPENILIDAKSDDLLGHTPRLTDFGLARLVDQEHGSSSIGMLVGTFDYMAPEQLMGLTNRIGPQSDIYALGVLLFQLLTGELPRHTLGNVFQAVEASRRLPSLRRHGRHISRDLEAICLKCLAFDSGDRFQSALELRDDLYNYIEDRPTRTRPLSRAESVARWSRMHRPASVAIILIASSILAALFVSIYASYELAKRNEQLTEARDASSLAESVAQEHERRYRELAWNSGLQLAFGELERGQLQGLSRSLKTLSDQHEYAVHRPAWKLLNAELESRYKLLLTEPVPLREVVAIPHSTMIAIGGDQSDVIIYDYLTNTVHKRLSTPIEQVHALAASPNGKLLAVGGSTYTDRDQATPLIIDWSTGSISQLEVSGPSTIESLQFSPNGKRLAVGFRYEDVLVANLERPSVPATALPASRRCRAIDWCSENEIVVHCDHGLLSVTDLQANTRVDHTFPQQIETFAVAKNRQWICVSNTRSEGCTLIAKNSPTKRVLLNGVLKGAKCLSISPDENFVAAGLDSGEVAVWEIPDELHESFTLSDAPVQPISRKFILGSGVTSLSWIGNELAVVGESGEMVRWSPANSLEQFAHGATVTAATFVTTKDLAFGTAKGEVTLIDSEPFLSRNQPPTKSSSVSVSLNSLSQPLSINNLIALTPQSLLASTADGNKECLYELKLPELQTEGPLVATISENWIANLVTDISSDGNLIAWGGDNNELRIIHRFSKKTVFQTEFTGDVWAVRFLNARQICVGGQFEGLRVFDLETKQLIATLGSMQTGAVFVDKSANSVVVGSVDGILRTWTIGTWELESALRTNESQIQSIAQNLDRTLGVSIDEQSNVIVFNPSQQVVYGRLREDLHTRQQYPIARMTCQFSPDGRKLLLLLVFFKNDQIRSIFQVYELNSGTYRQSHE